MTTHDTSSIGVSFADMRVAAARVFGDDHPATWDTLCAAADVAPDAVDASDEQIDAVLDGLAAHDPLGRVMAMSWRIRRTAARKLTELGR